MGKPWEWWKQFQVDYEDAEFGNWSVETYEIDQEQAKMFNWRESMNAIQHGRRRRSVEPGTYRRLVHSERGIVMSDTQAEIEDMAYLISPVSGQAKDRRTFLLNGLGLAILPRALLTLPQTEHIDIVEVDIEVIALTGPQFFNDPRVTIHHADALTVDWPKGKRWDFAWHDIWDSVTMLNYPDMVRLHRRYGRRSFEQASWMRGEVEREFGKERRYRE